MILNTRIRSLTVEAAKLSASSSPAWLRAIECKKSSIHIFLSYIFLFRVLPTGKCRNGTNRVSG